MTFQQSGDSTVHGTGHSLVITHGYTFPRHKAMKNVVNGTRLVAILFAHGGVVRGGTRAPYTLFVRGK